MPLPPLLLFVIHAVPALWVTEPTIMADEMGYLGTARYLSGTLPMADMRQSVYYHFGYSVLIAPVYWFSIDPSHSYQAIVLVNAALLSSLFFPLRYLAEQVCSLSRRHRDLVAFTACLYPAFLLQSTVAWSENAFIPAYAFHVAVFVALLRHRTLHTSLLLGVSSALLFTIHPRGASIGIVSVAYAFALAFRRRLPWPAAFAMLTAFVSIGAATHSANEHLQLVGWQVAATGTRVAATFAKISTAEGIVGFFSACAGQMSYLFASTYGIFPLALIHIFTRIAPLRDEAREDDPFAWHALTFLMLSAGSVVALSGIQMNDAARADQFIYGRYNEGILAPFLAIGLSVFFLPQSHRASVRTSTAIAATSLVLAAIVETFHGEAIRSGPIQPANIWGLSHFLLPKLVDLRLVAILAAVILGTSSYFRATQRGIAAVAVFSVSFLAASAATHVLHTRPSQERFRHAYSLDDVIRAIPEIDRLSYDMTYYKAGSVFGYQARLPGIRFDRFRSDKGEIPRSSFVISELDWVDAERLGALYWASDTFSNPALWILPGPAQDRLLNSICFIDRPLGTRRLNGLWEVGFYAEHHTPQGSLRWTNGRAKLRVPFPRHRAPRHLDLGLRNTLSGSTSLSIRANKVVLFERSIPPGTWSRTFSLDHVEISKELLIEIDSGAIVDHGGRRVGVAVSRVRLRH